ncbi:MAG TPA: chorismate mutase [Bryobacteraceae bacterium]|nr:chorismate mutase [Bryobacteraceae bacterium]
MNREEALRSLAESRKRIDELDVQLLELLNRRTRVVEQIGHIKESLAMPIYEPKREDDVFRNVIEHNEGPLTADAVKSIFERIIDEMRTLQRMRREQNNQGENEC